MPLLYDNGRDRVTTSDFGDGKLDIRVGNMDMTDTEPDRRLVVTFATAKELMVGLQKVIAKIENVDGY